MKKYYFCYFLILIFLPCIRQQNFHKKKVRQQFFSKLICEFNYIAVLLQVKYEPVEIEDHKLNTIAEIGDISNMNHLLDNILVPRVVGTEGHKNVKNFIIKTMKELNWAVETDQFKEKTPNLGTLKFENIIATLNPNADRFLILACHYDSKYFANMEFLGATDSAGKSIATEES